MFKYESFNDPIQRPRYTGLPTFMRSPYREDVDGVEVGLVGVLKLGQFLSSPVPSGPFAWSRSDFLK